MKRVIGLNPLNVGFGESLTNIITFSESEYATDVGRKIFVKSPSESYFKMKSTTATCYLEPAFFGIGVGDKMTVTMEVLTVSGNGGVELVYIPIKASGETNNPMSNNPKTKNMQNEHFEKIQMATIMSKEVKDNYGIIVNIRAKSLGEIIIKNVEIEIETSNSNFKANEDLLVYNNKAKFLKMINNAISSDCNIDIHKHIKDVYDLGDMTFGNNSIIINSAADGKFKGIYSPLCENNYFNPVSVYFEYKNMNDTEVVLTYRNYDSNLSSVNARDITLPVSENTVKKIFYFKPPQNDVEYTYIEIGRVGQPVNIEISNFMVFKNRYDDFVIFTKTLFTRY